MNYLFAKNSAFVRAVYQYDGIMSAFMTAEKRRCEMD